MIIIFKIIEITLTIMLIYLLLKYKKNQLRLRDDIIDIQERFRISDTNASEVARNFYSFKNDSKVVFDFLREKINEDGIIVNKNFKKIHEQTLKRNLASKLTDDNIISIIEIIKDVDERHKENVELSNKRLNHLIENFSDSISALNNRINSSKEVNEEVVEKTFFVKVLKCDNNAWYRDKIECVFECNDIVEGEWYKVLDRPWRIKISESIIIKK